MIVSCGAVIGLETCASYVNFVRRRYTWVDEDLRRKHWFTTAPLDKGRKPAPVTPKKSAVIHGLMPALLLSSYTVDRVDEDPCHSDC